MFTRYQRDNVGQATVRVRRGIDIDAGCGQLAVSALVNCQPSIGFLLKSVVADLIPLNLELPGTISGAQCHS